MVRGNHELMAMGAVPIPPERAGSYRIDEARRALSAESLAWLAGLPPSRDPNCRLGVGESDTSAIPKLVAGVLRQLASAPDTSKLTTCP